MKVTPPNSIIEKHGSALADSGVIGRILEKQVKDPKFREAFAEEYLRQAGNEIERIYQAYVKLAEDEKFAPLVQQELRGIAEATISSDEAVIQRFVDDALNNTDEFIRLGNQAADAASPDQLVSILKGDQEATRAVGNKLAAMTQAV